MTAYRIHFNRPDPVGRELECMAESACSGRISGDGSFTHRCQQALEAALGVPKVLLTTSCTHALEMAALLLDIQPGDEVIIPSFAFVSLPNAFVLRGARPVFADIRPDTLNVDENSVEAHITGKTRAVAIVHYAGVGCEMDSLLALTQKHGLPMIEDNAHGLFGKYKGRWLGTFGPMAAQSFHETKNFSCGEGGALLLNDRRYIERAEILREKGTDRSRFFRGQVDKYTWVDLGSSYLPSDLLAAFLWGQLEKQQVIQSRRRALWQRYDTGLTDWATASGVGRPVIPPHCEPAWHLYYLLLPSCEARQALMAHLRERGIMTVFHYLPLHRSPLGEKMGGRPGDCPVTEDISSRLVRLPFYNTLTDKDQDEVIEAIQAFRV